MQPLRVIVTTDKPALAECISVELERCGHRVERSQTPERSTELLLDGKGDVVVLDLLMAHSLGVELFLTCREHWPWLPLITFTQCPEGEAKVTLGRADAQVQTPFETAEPDHIVDCLRTCLAETAVA